ncbi:MAG: asparaginase domain-containing protein [Pseudomonadota bacterium]
MKENSRAAGATARSVALIYTGGTIGSAGTPRAPLPAAAFRALWEANLAGLPEFATPRFWHMLEPPLDSTEMTPRDWAVLATLVLDAAEAGAEAVVVLHGTDTLANSAAALAYLLTAMDGAQPVARLGIPVVLTGAMAPLFEGEGLLEGSDALANLSTALGFAAHGPAEPGVHLAFAGRTGRGARTAKLHTEAHDAFGWPSGPGRLAPLPPCPAASLRPALARLAPELGRRAVLLATPAPEDAALQAAILEGAVVGLAERIGALLLAGFGSGNMPAAATLGPVLTRLRARGVPVALASQVPAGGVAPDAYAAGAWLGRLGVLPAGDMTLAAAHAKLHVALAHAAAEAWDRDGIERFFMTPIAGERDG